jgi:hypothetical protein
MRFRQLRSSVLALVILVGVIGCAASNRIVSEWTNPDYSSPRFRKILIIAVSRDIYISETNLYDLTKNQLVWSGTVQTVDPSDINKEIKRYVDTVVEALKSKNLLPAK